MQKMGIMLSLIGDNRRLVLLIELKATEARIDNTLQIQRYVDWLEQYYVPNRISDIQPVLISKKILNKTSENYKKIIESLKHFNDMNNRCVPIKYVEYELEGNDLLFKVINY